jgi:SAM-dependent methyltransferase
MGDPRPASRRSVSRIPAGSGTISPRRSRAGRRDTRGLALASGAVAMVRWTLRGRYRQSLGRSRSGGYGAGVSQLPDPARARSFGASAEAYAAHRPGYPGPAVEWALDTVQGRVLDLAAGTGKLTASVVGRVRQVVAVEPDPAMLARLRPALPEVEAHEGTAERIPLPDSSVDAVLVGQAMHWFDPDRAFGEIARVLRPGGVLAGLWNADDGRVEWVRGYHEELARGRPEQGVPQGGDEPGFDPGPEFGPVRTASFRYRIATTVDGLVATLSTHSWALVSPPADRDAAFDRMRRYLGERPEVPDTGFELPMVTRVLRTVRR